MNSRRTLLKNASLVALSTSAPHVSASVQPKKYSRSKRLRNWCGDIILSGRKYLFPNSLDQFKQIIQDNESVTIVGKHHSYNNIAQNLECLVNIKKLNFECKIDRNSMTVVAPASMKLSTLNRILHKNGLALPIIGDIDEQRIGGLIATATHGTSLNQQTISCLVTAVTLLDARGNVRRFSEDGNEEERKFLKAARVHLGCLGAILSVELNIVPSFRLEEKTQVLSLNESLHQELIESNEMIQIQYMPFTESSIVKTWNRTSKEITNSPIKKAVKYFRENVLADSLLSVASLDPKKVPGFIRFYLRNTKDSTVVGDSFDVLASKRTMKYFETEMAVPYEDYEGAVLKCIEIVNKYAEKNEFYLNLPLSVRFVKGDDQCFLSPTRGRDTAYLTFISHHSFGKAYEACFQEIEKTLKEEFNAVPHWGKKFWLDPLDGYSSEDISDFLYVKNDLDPNSKFQNPFSKKLFKHT